MSWNTRALGLFHRLEIFDWLPYLHHGRSRCRIRLLGPVGRVEVI